MVWCAIAKIKKKTVGDIFTWLMQKYMNVLQYLTVDLTATFLLVFCSKIVYKGWKLSLFGTIFSVKPVTFSSLKWFLYLL